MKITALKEGKRRTKRVNVFLDGRYSFSLEAELVATGHVHIGQELSAADVEELTRSDQYHRCLNAAANLLSYRPRSESELKERLSRRSFTEESISRTIESLKRQGLVDDTAFAQFWKDNRDTFSPRSRWLTSRELKKKGVAADVISQVVSTVNDDDSAYHAALNRVRRLSTLDYETFRQRLGGYLQRRGFSYQVVNRTVNKMWRDKNTVPGDSLSAGSKIHQTESTPGIEKGV